MKLYQEDEGSTFSSNGRTYDLNRIFAAVQHEPISQIPVSKLAWVIRHVKDIDEERVARADITVPILVTHEEGHELVVDGFHRLVKAFRQKVPALPYRRVSKQVMDKTRITAALEHFKEPSFMSWN